MAYPLSFCSYPLARRLKELYAPQNSTYCWTDGPYGYGVLEEWDPSITDYVSAYEGDEIYDLIRDYIHVYGTTYALEVEETDKGYRVYYSNGVNILDGVVITALVYEDAIAEMLIYLLENKFMNPEDMYR